MGRRRRNRALDAPAFAGAARDRAERAAPRPPKPWIPCLVAAAALAMATALALSLVGGYALCWAWPTWLALYATRGLEPEGARWAAWLAVFAAFYLLVLWPLWGTRMAPGRALWWIGAQLAVLGIVFLGWFLPFMQARLGAGGEA